MKGCSIQILLTYGVHFLSFHLKIVITHSLQKSCLMLWGLNFPVIHYLFIFVMISCWLPDSYWSGQSTFLGHFSFCCKQLIFSCLLKIDGRFLFWHLMFFFVYILFTSQHFLPIFIVWKKGRSHCQFYQYLYLEDPFTGDLPFYYDFVI